MADVRRPLAEHPAAQVQYPFLVEREKDVIRQLEAYYDRLLEKHGNFIQDERSETHLQMACLVMATERALKPWLRNPQDVKDIIASQMGAFTSPAVRFLLRYIMYFMRDPFKSAARRLRWLRMDYGNAFVADFQESDRDAELRISDCFYNKLLRAEDAEHLLSCCCCSQDKVWFDTLEKHNIHFERREWLGAGDAACCLVLQKNGQA